MSTTSGLARLRSVRVGTRKRPKLEAVRQALAPFAPEVRVAGAEVESGVPEQPVGFSEIHRGARNRAEAAFRLGGCELGVGIEDGLVRLTELGDAVVNVGVAVVSDGRRSSFGLSSGFAYPPACSEPAIGRRAPIGDLFDALWRERRAPAGGVAAEPPSGEGLGNIGRLTLGALPRAEYGRHAVLCALLSWLHPDLYPDSSPELSPDPTPAPGKAAA